MQDAVDPDGGVPQGGRGAGDEQVQRRQRPGAEQVAQRRKVHGGELRTATVTATTAMRLIVLTAGRLATIEREIPGVSDQIRAALAKRMETTLAPAAD